MPQSAKSIAGLVILLVCLLLPIHAVAHDHQDDLSSGDASLEYCLFCQVASPKPMPVPGRSTLLPEDPHAAFVLLLQNHPDLMVQAVPDHAISVRGPPLFV